MDTYNSAIKQLENAITASIQKAIKSGALPEAEIPQFIIETPADRSHGDFATNAAMAGAKAFRMPPVKIAQAITENLDLEDTMCERFETAGPGFINFFLGKGYYANVIREILAYPENYGCSDFGNGEKVMVEFVSANPTGPMHMGNARGGALGDCLAAVLDKAGYEVWREFYVNDAGNQIEKFGNSLEARYLQIYRGDKIEFPEDGYHGADITEL
ncbi:MAG: arginine--tRNA ligase, partial [Clostridiales bacterium]|nr:arginine--tRNA ligase [Clostridiales bacterium]